MGRTENVELTVLCLIEDGDKILLQNYVVPSPVTPRIQRRFCEGHHIGRTLLPGMSRGAVRNPRRGD